MERKHGRIPQSLMNMRVNIKMDLSQSNLFDEIPDFFEPFSYMKLLNLSFNNLLWYQVECFRMFETLLGKTL